MIFKNIFYIKTTRILLFSSLFCLLLSLIRVKLSGRYLFLFLVWNLFLAFIPWALSLFLYFERTNKKSIFFAITFLWFLFFPNAPYLATDIIHFRISPPNLKWFDLSLLLFYSYTGLLYGFVSLDLIEKKIQRVFCITKPQIISILLLYTSCFGIYLGRFLRWNSWNLFTHTNELFADIFSLMKNPFMNEKPWIFTFLLGTLLSFLYWSYKEFKISEEDPLNNFL